ncbi:MAG TPA: AEC family transporter, partial [Kiloniellales bacterium]|nr:AEC family transporter [Kiloniellales bacterium]
LKGVRVGGATVAVAAGLKLLAVPALLAWVCQAFGVTGTAAFAAILFGATPSAPSAYILARQLGGDARLMASILTVQTLLAIVTLPLVLGLLAQT